jgi:outer membrane protein assembly factor BamB
MNRRSIVAFSTSLLTFAVVSCGGSEPPPEVPPPPPPASVAVPPPAPPPPPPPAAAEPEPAKAEKPAPVVRFSEGLSTPESVLYDAEGDRYLVSNINGRPDGVDNNGYIAELSPDGKLTNGKLIAGGVNKVKLDAPKGMGIFAGTLYVSDISKVRKFDVKTGAPKGDIAIPGATFLNDIAIAKDGRVFVSDSGVKNAAEGFAPTGSDAVYVIDKAGKVKTIAKSKELGGPNGLVVTDDGLLVNTLTSNELYRLDEKGVRKDVNKLPAGGLDGLLVIGDTLYVSSWQASAIYRGKLGGTFEVAFADQKGAADIGYDSKRQRILIPKFLDSAVEVFEIK